MKALGVDGAAHDLHELELLGRIRRLARDHDPRLDCERHGRARSRAHLLADPLADEAATRVDADGAGLEHEGRSVAEAHHAEGVARVAATAATPRVVQERFLPLDRLVDDRDHGGAAIRHRDPRVDVVARQAARLARPRLRLGAPA